MHLLLIRHAESVDNVAGLYGGSRDAALTAHGVLQARRLASALKGAGLDTRHVFSSPLQRAAKTADAICDAYNYTNRAANEHRLTATQVPELREKHFGSWEGVKYASAAFGVSRPPQTNAETPEAMRARVNSFLDQHLWPIVSHTIELHSEMACVVVVSHGILLGVLAQTLASKLSRGSSSGASVAKFSSHRISWSNTGYLDIEVVRPPTVSSAMPPVSRPWSSLHSSISQVNCTKHLARLRKTRGGIGSAAHDNRQRTLEGFFGTTSRKRKADEYNK
ncbi:hypothetical protein E4U43_008667 [Claviceps pusilla]|uniref:Phosphoglycerate mutase family protein n=1 Tax=Claviceps pusilla TaxID=123648 RepID=A0A9P7NIV8_9HYPO|nr:hypothetical protein E4U43_008667 [Claviceps pusilla]